MISFTLRLWSLAVQQSNKVSECQEFCQVMRIFIRFLIIFWHYFSIKKLTHFLKERQMFVILEPKISDKFYKQFSQISRETGLIAAASNRFWKWDLQFSYLYPLNMYNWYFGCQLTWLYFTTIIEPLNINKVNQGEPFGSWAILVSYIIQHSCNVNRFYKQCSKS